MTEDISVVILWSKDQLISETEFFVTIFPVVFEWECVYMDSHSWDQCDRGHTVAAAANNISKPAISNHPYCLTLHFQSMSFPPQCFHFQHTHTFVWLFGCTFPHSQTFLCCQGKTASLSKTKVLLKWRYNFTENSIFLQLDIGDVVFPKMSDLNRFLDF